MRSGRGESSPAPLPRALEADHREFLRFISPWLARRSFGAHLADRLSAFGALVYEASERLSLVSRADRNAIFMRHVLDSLNPVTLFDPPPGSAIDVGSGGGFPGIPLAIAWPETSITLLEARDRKAGFLERAVRELGLGNVRVVCDHLDRYDVSWRVPRQEVAMIRALGDLAGTLGKLESICVPRGTWVYFLGAGRARTEVGARLVSWGAGAEEKRGEFGGILLVGRFGPLGSA